MTDVKSNGVSLSDLPQQTKWAALELDLLEKRRLLRAFRILPRLGLQVDVLTNAVRTHAEADKYLAKLHPDIKPFSDRMTQQRTIATVTKMKSELARLQELTTDQKGDDSMRISQEQANKELAAELSQFDVLKTSNEPLVAPTGEAFAVLLLRCGLIVLFDLTTGDELACASEEEGLVELAERCSWRSLVRDPDPAKSFRLWVTPETAIDIHLRGRHQAPVIRSHFVKPRSAKSVRPLQWHEICRPFSQALSTELPAFVQQQVQNEEAHVTMGPEHRPEPKANGPVIAEDVAFIRRRPPPAPGVAQTARHQHCGGGPDTTFMLVVCAQTGNI